MDESQLRRLFAGPVTFELSAPSLASLPEPAWPEVALAGRSNVGKSTLLNAMLGRKSLARTSNTPGRTQQLNFFRVGEPVWLRLVDMPGYGYAEAPRNVVRQWGNLVRDYLRGRAVLKRVLLLIDARRGIGDVDRDIMGLLDKAAVSYQLVLTKIDKVKPDARMRLLEAVAGEARQHPAAHPQLLPTSSITRAGIADLQHAIAAAVRDA